MPQKITTLRNIGPKIGDKLIKIGIKDAENFKKQDPYEVFDRMLIKEPDLCRCALASIVGASVDVPWMKVHKKAAKEFGKKYPQHEWKTKC